MTNSLSRIGITAALTAAMGLAHAQLTSSPPGTGSTGTVSPSGVLTAPGSVVTPGSPTIPAPSVPSATTPLPGASGPTSPDAGSLSGTVDQRNRPNTDTFGSPSGNGSITSPNSSARPAGSGTGTSNIGPTFSAPGGITSGSSTGSGGGR